MTVLVIFIDKYYKISEIEDGLAIPVTHFGLQVLTLTNCSFYFKKRMAVSQAATIRFA